MTTKVVLTGTGVPTADPDRAGAGTLVVYGDIALQFDAGRATTMRLAAAGTPSQQLDAVFLTHHHSDHLVGLVDVVFCHWLQGDRNGLPLEIVTPSGPCQRFAERMLDPWVDDIAVRSHDARDGGPRITVTPFEPATDSEPTLVWSKGDVHVFALSVHHEPVLPAVGYRIETPDGVVAISGDTVACAEVERLAQGADVLVHETFDRARLAPFFEHLPHLEAIAGYHADTPDVGASAVRAGVGTLVLTHLVPAPRTADEEQLFVDAIRRGGFDGRVVVGADLTNVTLDGRNTT